MLRALAATAASSSAVRKVGVLSKTATVLSALPARRQVRSLVVESLQAWVRRLTKTKGPQAQSGKGAADYRRKRQGRRRMHEAECQGGDGGQGQTQRDGVEEVS